jgi:hypothetical protein
MGRFIQDGTGVVVSVDDSKDDRFASGWKPFDGDDTPKRGPGRPKKTEEDK